MKTTDSSKEVPRIDGARVEILQASWHRQYTDCMVGPCSALLREVGCGTLTTHIIPGSLELPLAALTLLERHKDIEAIIAFGIIVKGDTYHFELVANESARGLCEVMLRYQVPIIIEVLPVYDIAQADARSRDDEQNKGREAARAAAQMISWRRKI